MARESQAGKDIRVFCFKLDRRVPDEAIARQQLEEYLDNDGNLRDAIIKWLAEGEQRLVVVADTSIEDQVERAMQRFEERLVNLLMNASPDQLRDYAEQREKSDDTGGTKLTEDFVNGMLRGFNR